MADHSRYKSPSGAQLTLRLRTSGSLDLDQRLFLMVDGRGMFIPTAELLAMIDAAEPDALRAYLRERSDLIDGPGEPLTVNGANMTAEEYLDAVPEADSPEDVDERPTPATIERLDLLEQIRDLYPNLPPSRHIGVVHWLLEGTVLVERVERLLDRSAR